VDRVKKTLAIKMDQEKRIKRVKAKSIPDVQATEDFTKRIFRVSGTTLSPATFDEDIVYSFVDNEF